MDIVIIGDGKVGHKLAMQLSGEKYNVTLIDKSERKLRDAVNEMDVSCVVGDGASADIQRQADVPGADLVIACASTDEMNLFCCLLARKLGARQTIARVRNPIYHNQIDLLKEDLKLSMAVNPERALAGEISRVLIFPSAAKLETFVKGRVELVEVTYPSHSSIEGLSLSELYKKHQIKMLVCAVQRDGAVYIPDGNFVPQPGDKINITASHPEIEKFLKLTKGIISKAKNVMICGGGRVAYYRGRQLLELGMQVKIIEVDEKRCMELCDLLPKATIIHGNATDLIFNVIDCFLLLLGNISLSFCLNSGCLCLSFLDHGFTACCSVLLGILENGICSFFCFCHFSFIISLHGIRFFLCLFRILDLRISQCSSLLDDRAYRLEQEFLDQPALDEQVADLGNESPRYDRY